MIITAMLAMGFQGRTLWNGGLRLRDGLLLMDATGSGGFATIRPNGTFRAFLGGKEINGIAFVRQGGPRLKKVFYLKEGVHKLTRLPPGSYEVQAVVEGQTVKARTPIQIVARPGHDPIFLNENGVPSSNVTPRKSGLSFEDNILFGYDNYAEVRYYCVRDGYTPIEYTNDESKLPGPQAGVFSKCNEWYLSVKAPVSSDIAGTFTFWPGSTGGKMFIVPYYRYKGDTYWYIDSSTGTSGDLVNIPVNVRTPDSGAQKTRPVRP